MNLRNDAGKRTLISADCILFGMWWSHPWLSCQC